VAKCPGISDAALVALSRYRRRPDPNPAGAANASHTLPGPPTAPDAELLGHTVDILNLEQPAPRRATLARSRVEAGFAAARAAHRPDAPGMVAAGDGGGGGLEELDVGSCGAVSDSGVQVRPESYTSLASCRTLPYPTLTLLNTHRALVMHTDRANWRTDHAAGAEADSGVRGCKALNVPRIVLLGCSSAV